MQKAVEEEADKRGVKVVKSRVALLAPMLIFPILPINVITLAIIQHNVNKLYEAEDKA